MMPGTATATGNGVSALRTGGVRVLPEGASGLLLVGMLRFAAPAARNAKQFALDLECPSVDGRPTIESASGWIADQDGAPTPFGALVMGGRIGTLIGRQVVVAVSARVSRDKLYFSVEGLWPLDEPKQEPAA